MYSIPIRHTGRSYYVNGDRTSSIAAYTSSSDRLPRSSSVSSYRSSSIADYEPSTRRTGYGTSTYSSYAPSSSGGSSVSSSASSSSRKYTSASRPPLPTPSTSSSSRYIPRSTFDGATVASIPARQYSTSSAQSLRSSSMDRRRATASATTITTPDTNNIHDRRPLYDRLLERNIEDNHRTSNGHHYPIANGVDQLHLSSNSRPPRITSNNNSYQSTSSSRAPLLGLQRSPSSTLSTTDSSPDDNIDNGADDYSTADYLSSTPKSLYRSVASSMPNVPSLRTIVTTTDSSDRRPTTSGNSSSKLTRLSKKSDEDDSSQKSSSDDGTTKSAVSHLSKSSSSLLSRSSIDDSTGTTRGLLGLTNIGNTCFMNSILQCLSHTQYLREFCLRECSPSDCNTSSRMKGALMKAFCDLIKQLWSARAGSITPDMFKSQIQRFAPRFVGYQQQDSQEFLRYLLQGLHDDVNRSRPTNNYTSTISIDDNSVSERLRASECWKRYLRTDDSRIVDLFVGQLKSELKCEQCSHISTTFDPFWDLSLPIAVDRKPMQVSLNDCFNAFTREEILDGEEMPNCDNCRTRRRSTKKLSIYKFPKLLVIHLKRFSGEKYRCRLSTLVNYPVTNLDLTAFGSSNDGLKPVYNLYAISNHSGTPCMGHYTAYIRHAINGQWYLFDDSRVTQQHCVVSSEAYVLFYELCIESSKL